MLAIYKNETYAIVKIDNEKVILLAYLEPKDMEGWEPRHECFQKTVDIQDEDLSTIYTAKFVVKSKKGISWDIVRCDKTEIRGEYSLMIKRGDKYKSVSSTSHPAYVVATYKKKDGEIKDITEESPAEISAVVKALKRRRH